MATLTPKTISELPATSALGDTDLVAISQSSASKRITGRLLKDAGYRVGTAVQSGDDLDDYTTAGVYAIPSSTVAATLSNCPYTASNSRLEVFDSGNSQSNFTLQTIKGTGNNDIYYRRQSNGTWNPWVKIVVSDANGVVPITSGGTGGNSASAARDNLGLGGIGSLVAEAASSVPVSTSERTEILRTTLSAGKWVIIGTLSFEPNGTGFRRAYFSVGSDENPSVSEQSQTNATDAANSFVQVMAIRSFSADTTVRLMAFHNAGVAVGVVGYIRAIQII